jgi:undecaprenyl-diphosphatase
MEMQNLNLQLFMLFNAPASLSGWPLFLAMIVAKYIIYIVPLMLVVYWLWGPIKFRSTLLFAVISAVVALIINFSFNAFWFLPRPFAVGIGHTYLHHVADNSFPSDHVTFMWAVGLSFLIQAGMRLSGVIILLLSISVGWARVYLGIHYPFDILGAIFIASLVVNILSFVRPFIDKYILPLADWIYKRIFSKAITLRWINE